MMTYRKILVVGVAGLLLGGLPIVATAVDQPYFITLGCRMLIYGLAAVSLDLLLGYGNLISLGHAAFIGIGAYVVGIMHYHSFNSEELFTWPFVCSGSDNGLVVLPLAMLVAALAGVVIGSLSLRTRGMHFIMITLAFAQMIYYFFVSLEKYGGDDGLSLFNRNSLPGLDLSRDTQLYYCCFAALIVVLLVSTRLVSSRFGLVIRGGGNNERRLAGLGIHPNRYKLTVFVISAAFAGLAGGLLANQTEYISPGLMHWTLSGELMVMVLLGGLGSLYGPVFGAVAFLLLEELLSSYTEHWMVYMGPLLILAVVFAKRGIFGLLAGNWREQS
jgi:branched-chain amino acid transport system permease protein